MLFKVVRTALTDAAGVASLLCTAEVKLGYFISDKYTSLLQCVITEIPEKAEGGAGGPEGSSKMVQG